MSSQHKALHRDTNVSIQSVCPNVDVGLGSSSFVPLDSSRPHSPHQMSTVRFGNRRLLRRGSVSTTTFTSTSYINTGPSDHDQLTGGSG